MMISLIVPVYNVAPYLREFLDSVVNQTFEDYEAIFVDDGSTDESGKILDEYAFDHAKFQVIHKANGGVVSAWKQGVQESRGEYLAFADPDDILLPEMLATQIRLMKEHDADLVITGIKKLIGGKYVNAAADQLGLPEKLYVGEELERIKKCLFGNHENPQTAFYFWKPNKLFKRSLVIDNLQFNKNVSFGEDVCISASAIYDSKRVYYGHCPLYIYRIRDNSLTTEIFNPAQIDNAALLIDAVFTLLRAKGYLNPFVIANFQAYHICYLTKKILAANSSTDIKKRNLQLLSRADFVKNYSVKTAKKHITKNQKIAIRMLKSPLRGLLLFAKF